MGYPEDLLGTRAIVKPGLWAVIPDTGLVNNKIPEITGCYNSIVASPKMGAGFVQIVVEGNKGGKTVKPYAKAEGIESFIYLVEGEAILKTEGVEEQFQAGGYVYAPPGVGIEFEIVSDQAKLLLYKQKYIPYENLKPYAIAKNINDIEYQIYDGMKEVLIKDFLPTDDLAFDMNMHILSFEPGACHPFVETHVQEHGAYVLTGEGMYLLDDTWMGIKKNDFMWMGAYCPQAAYGVGREAFSYIYSKDCNRDVVL